MSGADAEFYPTFSQYINRLCAEKGVTAAGIIKKANIERTYGHKIFNGTRTPSRDTALQLAFGFKMTFEETQKLLAIARKNPLHPKVKRDAVIVFVLKEGLGLNEVQATLSDLGFPVLGKERTYG
jgi:transcriptional regulator with XRE-family HTH domain